MDNSVLKDMKKRQLMRSGSSGKKFNIFPAFITRIFSSLTSFMSFRMWADFGLFIGCVYGMFRFGDSLSAVIDDAIPTEKKMVEQMQEMMKMQQE